MTETDHPLDRLDAPTRIIKRAQYEALEFELLGTNIRVRNESHADPDEHEYLVELENDLPVSCTCPAEKHYENACKHRVAVALRRPIIEFATDLALLADGGSVPEHSKRPPHGSEEAVDRDDEPENDTCDCSDLPVDVPCWECYRAGEASFD